MFKNKLSYVMKIHQMWCNHISIKIPIIYDPFQCYEMEPPNQPHDKIDQFESCDVKPL